jgi:hypothetical protein
LSALPARPNRHRSDELSATGILASVAFFGKSLTFGREIIRISAFLMIKIDTLLFSLNPIEKNPSSAFGHLYINSVFS